MLRRVDNVDTVTSISDIFKSVGDDHADRMDGQAALGCDGVLPTSGSPAPARRGKGGRQTIAGREREKKRRLGANRAA